MELSERILQMVREAKIIESYERGVGVEHRITNLLSDANLPELSPRKALIALRVLELDGKVQFWQSAKWLKAVLWVNPNGVPTASQLVLMKSVQRAAAIHAVLTSGSIPEIDITTGVADTPYTRILAKYFPGVSEDYGLGVGRITHPYPNKHVAVFQKCLRQHGYLEEIGGLVVLKITAETRQKALEQHRAALAKDLAALGKKVAHKQEQMQAVMAVLDSAR